MPVDKSAVRVRDMFGQIAPRYDLLNRLLSGGIDQRWRKKTVRLVPPRGAAPILDLCTGTGDLALAYARAAGGAAPVVAADFCRPMLVRGADKARPLGRAIAYIEADALRLPFADNTFQIVSVAFGLRNLVDAQAGLAEMTRVLRPGGRLAVLEFSLPRWQPLKSVYRWYFHRVLPRIGQALARNRADAYNYLPTSVEEFPSGQELAARMSAAGLSDVRHRPLTFGVATLYLGRK